jgi:hypothetical protein
MEACQSATWVAQEYGIETQPQDHTTVGRLTGNPAASRQSRSHGQPSGIVKQGLAQRRKAAKSFLIAVAVVHLIGLGLRISRSTSKKSFAPLREIIFSNLISRGARWTVVDALE